jgi:hypothetical protein
LLAERDPVSSAAERVAAFLQHRQRSALADQTFQRAAYMAFHPWLSTATATRDLKEAAAAGRLTTVGTGRSAAYGMARLP